MHGQGAVKPADVVRETEHAQQGIAAPADAVAQSDALAEEAVPLDALCEHDGDLLVGRDTVGDVAVRGRGEAPGEH